MKRYTSSLHYTNYDSNTRVLIALMQGAVLQQRATKNLQFKTPSTHKVLADANHPGMELKWMGFMAARRSHKRSSDVTNICDNYDYWSYYLKTLDQTHSHMFQACMRKNLSSTKCLTWRCTFWKAQILSHATHCTVIVGEICRGVHRWQKWATSQFPFLPIKAQE